IGEIIEIEDVVNDTINDTEPNVTSNGTPDTTPDTAPDTTSKKPQCGITGFRREDTYCSKDKMILTQKDRKEACEENYECKSNYCKEEKCGAKGFFSKMIYWFIDLFD
ncbi:unnamed protein product, partial [marine sediment metagenome]